MKRYALVVGIGQYQHLNGLSKPAVDAAAVRSVLQARGDFSLEIPLLVDGQATQANVQAALKRVLKEQGKGAEVLIYFTGHGFVAGESEYEQKGYLATYDCRVTIEGDRIISAQRGISFEFLNGLIGEAELAGLAVLLDCCHSEWFIDQALIGESLKVFKNGSYFLSAACRSFEEARAKKEAAHSVYSGALLAALGDRSAGRITVLDVHNSVVKALVQAKQEPISFGFGTGFVVVDDRIAVPVQVVDESVCPYQGLLAFTDKTKQFFFGRDGEVVELLRKLEVSNFVPVIGPSGIGKSSIVRAGLIPRLTEQGWRILGPIKPGPDPIGELKRSFRDLFPERRLNWVYERIEAGDLGLVVAELSGQFLLVIDQFEEMFTVCINPEQRQRFITQLVTVGTNRVRPPGDDTPRPPGDDTPRSPGVDSQANSRLAIVTTMRSDFIDDWLKTGQPPKVIQDQTVMVGPLQEPNLQDAIVKPVELLRFGFGEGLLELILADVEAEPNSLPLLEFALSELWKKRDQEKRLLTAAAYREMGGLKGALNTCSEMLYASLPKPEQEWVQQICLQLVRIGKGEADTRQRRPMADLLAMGADAAIQQTIEAAIGELVRGRLLVTDGDESGKIVDLAHEALMRGWERLALWRQENRDQQRLKQRIEDDYEAWIFHQRSNDYLLPKGLLQELQRLVSGERDTVLISAELCDFFRLSEEYQQRTTSLSQAGAMSELLEEKANILELSPDKRVDQVLMSIALIDKSMHHFQRVVEPVQEMLDYARKNLFECLKIEGHSGIVFCVAINPTGDRIISGSEDGTLRLWNLEGQQIGEPFQGHSAAVRSVAFSPNGELIVSGSSDSTVRLWSLDGTPIGEPFQGHLAGVLSVTFNPWSNWIISGSADATLKLWDLDGWVIQSFHGHSDSVLAVAFNPTSDQIVSASDDFTLRLWDLNGVQIGEPFQGHSDGVSSVAFSPTDDLIVSGSADTTLRLWDLSGSQIGEPFQGHSDGVLSAAFSPSGNQIVSGSDDKTIQLWNLHGEKIGEPLQGHSDGVFPVAFNPSGDCIVSGSCDHTFRIWNLNREIIPKAIWQSSHGRKNPIWSVAFSPSGDRIVSGSDDNTLRLWDLQGQMILPERGSANGGPFQGHSNSVLSVAFSPSGDRIVSGSADNTLRLWDLQGQMIGDPFQGHSNSVLSVAFSPSGDRIVSGSHDNTLRLWDLQGQMILPERGSANGDPFQGHSGSVWSVALSPSGDRIVSGSSDNTLRLWDLQGQMILPERGSANGDPFQGHSNSVLSVAFSPSGDRIVSGSSDNTLRLWDLQGQMIGDPFQGHSGSVWSVAFSPSGDRIVSGSSDNTLRLWDLQGQMIGDPFQGHSDSVLSVAFSPQGDRIVSGSADGTLRLWRGGTWRDWLHDCCTKLMFHSDLVSPKTPYAHQACETCKTQAWTRPETARFLRAQARALQRQNHPEAAAAKLAEAQQLDPEPNP